MIAIIDYGVGNVFSLSSSLTYLGYDNTITRDPAAIRAASRIILPGVGAYGDAMGKLRQSGVIPALDAQVKAGKPLMGICLGMQLLFERGFEYGVHQGLGYLQGSVCSLADELAAAGLALKIPHMGWNSLHLLKPRHPLLAHTREGDYVYFVHSFHAKDCADSLLATSDYGLPVAAACGSGNVCGCQFHPEKSGAVGLKILKAFCEMEKGAGLRQNGGAVAAGGALPGM